MRLQGLIVLVWIICEVAFALMNPHVLLEKNRVQLLVWASQEPVTALALAAATSVLLLMLALGGVGNWMRAREGHRLVGRLEQCERELAELHRRGYDEVSGKLDTLRREIMAAFEEAQEVGRRREESVHSA